MRNFIYTISLVLIGVSTYAQTANQILDKVRDNYESQKSFYIKFKSNLENKATKTQDNYEGEVYVKGNKYNLTIPKMNIRQIYDGKKLYTISTDNQEITVTQPESGSEDLLTPTRIFSIYKKEYDLSIDKKKGNIQYIKLVPQKKSDLKYILIGVDSNKNQLKELIQVNTKNTATTFSIEKEVNNVIVPSSLINFDEKFYKDYYISEI